MRWGEEAGWLGSPCSLVASLMAKGGENGERRVGRTQRI